MGGGSGVAAAPRPAAEMGQAGPRKEAMTTGPTSVAAATVMAEGEDGMHGREEVAVAEVAEVGFRQDAGAKGETGCNSHHLG
jgi:hypothetical protein